MTWLRSFRKRRWIRREADIARTEPDTMARHAQTEEVEPGSLQTVTLRDRIGGPWWALGLYGPVLTVDIGTHCPRCGEPRGLPQWRGRVQTWTNPCGHLDRPAALIDEASELLLGARVDAQIQRIHNRSNLIAARSAAQTRAARAARAKGYTHA
ncbi:hypothetical protein ACWEO2_39955 [Nocardia sp. NPDC004278]